MIEGPAITILLHLVLAHIIVDFPLQPNSWVQDRKKNGWRSRSLIFHASLAGILPLLFLCNLDYWYIAILFAVSHYIIDGVKGLYADELRYYVADQITHFAIIVVVWAIIVETSFDPQALGQDLVALWNDHKVILVLIALAFLTWPTGTLIGKITERWRNSAKEGNVPGLDRGGRYIGYAERIIILVLVLANQFTALGLIVATKSIFRLKEGSSQAEYYLIGSMLSFSFAIVTGLFINYLISIGI